MVDVTVQVSIDGGAQQQGGIDITTSNSAQFSLVDTDGVTYCLWEIYDYPTGATTPAGWTAATGRWYYVGLTPPSISFSGKPWGKYMVRATGNGSIIDEATALRLQSPSGLHGISRYETTQWGSWAAELKHDMVILEVGVVLPVGTYTGQPLAWNAAIPDWGLISNITLANGYISVGASPAQTGTFRTINGFTLKARNYAATADLTVLTLSTSDRTFVGNSTGDTTVDGQSDVTVRVNATAVARAEAGGLSVFGYLLTDSYIEIGNDPANTGQARYENGAAAKHRNFLGTADLNAFTRSTANRLFLGDVSGNTTIDGVADVTIRVNSTAVASCDANGFLVYGYVVLDDYLEIGTDPADTGQIRIENGATIKSRNQAGSADLQIATVSAADRLFLGNTLGNTTVDGGSELALRIGGSNSIVANSSGISVTGYVDMDELRIDTAQLLSATALGSLTNVIAVRGPAGSIQGYLPVYGSYS